MSSTTRSATLFLVRHGRTAANHHTYVGWGDPRLDVRGIEQSWALLDMLKDERLDALYSSPLARARETLRPLALLQGLEVRIRHEMREINYGLYQGFGKDTLPLKLRKAHRYQPMPAGESLFDVYLRVRRFSAEVTDALLNGRRIVVVGHYWSNRILIGCLLHMTFDAMMDAPPYKPVTGSVLEVVCSPCGDGMAVRRAELRAHEGLAS